MILGSSPPTRGARPQRRPDRCGQRIIPAYAGSTISSSLPRLALPDHPRLRGEHKPVSNRSWCGNGSSPPTRGARLILAPPLWMMRIIPAYAGSTLKLAHSVPAISDHPRLRGEHARNKQGTERGYGSSPPTRGALALTHACCALRRIIPAYAGSTPSISERRSPISDHPRLRGEHIHETPSTTTGTGSSPPTRGARDY